MLVPRDKLDWMLVPRDKLDWIDLGMSAVRLSARNRFV
jgi:hypothetical protein